MTPFRHASTLFAAALERTAIALSVIAGYVASGKSRAGLERLGSQSSPTNAAWCSTEGSLRRCVVLTIESVGLDLLTEVRPCS